MKFYLVKSICKRCPYSVLKECVYKTVFYKHVPKFKHAAPIKLVHKCLLYRQIFTKGQHVTVDLHHQVMMPDGTWEYVLAYEDVPGIVKGLRGSKYIIEFFEAFFLWRKKKRSSQTDHAKLFIQCTKAAKDIKPFALGQEGVRNIHHYQVNAAEKDLVLS